MTKIVASNQARRDLAKKIRLERLLIKDLIPFNNRLIKEMTTRFASSGEILNAAEFSPEMEAMLLNHYERTGDAFSIDISKTLPPSLAETDGETLLIASLLAIFYPQRASQQTRYIMATTQKNISQSIIAGTRQAAIDVPAGQLPSRRDAALNANASLKIKLHGRNTSISNTETQAVAERAKQIEARVLTTRPRLIAPIPKALKEWVTAGDEIVRRTPFSHVAADGQKVVIDGVFIVSGQTLIMPGDTSRGASLGNVINCRCASVVDRDSVLAARKFIFDKNLELEIETVVDVPEFAFT